MAMTEYGTDETSQLTGRVRAEIVQIKTQILEGSVELTSLGVIGATAMFVTAFLAFITIKAPVRMLVLAYCMIGSVILLLLEGIHRPHAGFSQLTPIRTYLYQELHLLTTLTGRALAYFFFGTLMLANSGWLGMAVGAYLLCLAAAMIFVAARAGRKLTSVGEGLTREELAAKFDEHDFDNDGKLSRDGVLALCTELGTDLTVRELESALSLLDADQTGSVDKDQFLAWWYGANWQRLFLQANRPFVKDDAEHGAPLL